MKPTEKELRDAVRAAVLSRLRMPAAVITDEQPLYGPEGAGLASLELFELIQAIEDEFGFAIPDEDMARLNSVSGIVEYVRARTRTSGA